MSENMSRNEGINGFEPRPIHETRPENIPTRLRTEKEQAGLDYEDVHRRTPPISFYVITQILFSYFGLHADYYYIELCDNKDHQFYKYRHQKSDQFLRMASFCYDCQTCPHKVIEHAHAPGQPCTIKCDNRVVFRPGGQAITLCGHHCWSHVEPFPTFFSRQLIHEYPKDMAFSPFFATKSEFRNAKKLAKKTLHPAQKMVQTIEARRTVVARFTPTIDPEDLIRLFSD